MHLIVINVMEIKVGTIARFTGKTVCTQLGCSVPSIGWITQGADLCRIEQDFHDKWSPLL